MAFPLGANAAIYNQLVANHPGEVVTEAMYNMGVDYVNAMTDGPDMPHYGGASSSLPAGNLASSTPLGGSTNQAQGSQALEDFLTQLLSGGQIDSSNIGNANDLMQLMGTIYPELAGNTNPDTWAGIIAAGGGSPTLAAQQLAATTAYNNATLGVNQAQLELNRIIAENDKELGYASLALQKELGYAGFDLQRELKEIDKQLQLTLQANSLAEQKYEFDKSYGLQEKAQQFSETMMGYQGASMPGLAGSATPSVTG